MFLCGLSLLKLSWEHVKITNYCAWPLSALHCRRCLPGLKFVRQYIQCYCLTCVFVYFTFTIIYIVCSYNKFSNMNISIWDTLAKWRKTYFSRASETAPGLSAVCVAKSHAFYVVLCILLFVIWSFSFVHGVVSLFLTESLNVLLIYCVSLR